MSEKRSSLAHELEELFDIRNAKIQDEKRLTRESLEAQRDIRLLTFMFRDGVPDMTVPINDNESIRWDSKAKQLIYFSVNSSQVLEGASRQTMIRVRPHLNLLVKQAKDFYTD